jgi:hypothetical protein
VAITHVRGVGQTIVTWVTLMNGAGPKLSFDQ